MMIISDLKNLNIDDFLINELYYENGICHFKENSYDKKKEYILICEREDFLEIQKVFISNFKKRNTFNYNKCHDIIDLRK